MTCKPITYTETDFTSMLDHAKLHAVWHPMWKRLKGTPFENDVPVMMVEFAQKYLKAAQSHHQPIDRSGEVEKVCGAIKAAVKTRCLNHYAGTPDYCDCELAQAKAAIAAMQPVQQLSEDEAVAIMRASKPERMVTKRYSEFNDASFEEDIEYIQTDRSKYRALLAAMKQGA